MEGVSIPMVIGVLAVLVVLAMNMMKVTEQRRHLHEERMSAIQKGVSPPESLEDDPELDRTVKSVGRNSALQGTVWTALGVGMLTASRLVRHSDLDSEMLHFLAFLELWAYPAIFVGVGLLIFAFFSREKKH
jgi:hypothetical protein